MLLTSAAMKRFMAAMCGVLWAACGAGDDTIQGTRAECAQGGALTDCPDAERTSEGACWRLVDCGAIAVKSDDKNKFTWGHCVDALDSTIADRRRVIINCIAASTCDELRVQGSPTDPDPNRMQCFRLGGF